MIIQSVAQISSISCPRYEVILGILLDDCRYYLKTKKIIFEQAIIKMVLQFNYISLSRLLRWYYQIEIKLPKEVYGLKKDRYLIVANHRRMIDPYLILATLPAQAYDNLLPVRLFTANIFLKYWWQRCVMLPFGCFRAYSTEGKLSGVKGGLRLSDRGHSLFIFPEGKRVESNSRVEPKIGIAYLAQRRDFTILPVYINYIKNSFNKKTHISWGKPFRIENDMESEDLDKLTKHIFNKVQILADKG